MSTIEKRMRQLAYRLTEHAEKLSGQSNGETVEREVVRLRSAAAAFDYCRYLILEEIKQANTECTPAS